MRHVIRLIVLLLVLTGTVTAGTDLEMLAQRCPIGTIGFVATSGTEDFGAEFKGSVLGQIACDAQVQSFFEQLFASLGKAEFSAHGAEAKVYLEFAKQVFRSPSILAVSVDPATICEAPIVMLISRTVTDQNKFNAALQDLLKSGIGSEKRLVHGSTVYTSADPNQGETFYLAQRGDLFFAVLNDAEFTMLLNGPENVELASRVRQVPSAQDMLIGYVDMQKILLLAEEESGEDFQTVKSVLQTLGLQDMRYAVMHAGFEGSSLVAQNCLKVSTAQGIWNAFSPVDSSLFNHVDPKAVQAGVIHLDPAVLYDRILGAIAQVAPEAGPETQTKIAEAEALLDFKIRDDLLANIDGAMLGYALPAYASPELMTGGYVATVRLRDAAKVESCMNKLGQVIQSFGQNQVQVTSQQTADGKPVHIWAVTVMAMMQIIPSWAIEGDILIITSHPTLTKSMMARLASGQKDSMVSDPRFAALLKTIPLDAVAVGLSDSQANARQLMQGLQQVWPMLNMGLMQEGIQLPIMLPSIDAYIERMEPGVRYLRKTNDGIESYYKGTGLEVSTGGAAGAGMAAAIMMPALGKTKQIAQRVVSGTNLKQIGVASFVYAADHDGQFPTSFEVLMKEAEMSPKSFENPRKPDGFAGPDYILVQGLTRKASAEMVLAYENPEFIRDDQINVLYADGHTAAESKETLKQGLQKTYKYLGQPMPEIKWGD
jgi:prepilin-type processing-associated H-X9-DG protein